MLTLYRGDCLQMTPDKQYDTVFMDPPDGLDIKYDEYLDTPKEYAANFQLWLNLALSRARVVWVSFNSRHTILVGNILWDLLDEHPFIKVKPCQQVITFYQHNKHDLGNAHRPLYRISWNSPELYPDRIRIESQRQKDGDKRANDAGKVPGDVFDFSRVTGNSKQRRNWCPTQLNEGLVERCLLLTTPAQGTVLDLFSGTGTTMRVCHRLALNCDSIEISKNSCNHIARDNDLRLIKPGIWSNS